MCYNVVFFCGQHLSFDTYNNLFSCFNGLNDLNISILACYACGNYLMSIGSVILYLYKTDFTFCQDSFALGPDPFKLIIFNILVGQ